MESTPERPDASRSSSSKSQMSFISENSSMNAHSIASNNLSVENSSHVTIHNYGKHDDGSEIYKPKAMASWLRSSAASNYPGRHNKHYEMRTPGTLDWVFQSKAYSDWVEGDGESTNRNLAYVGLLGCGKSVLASAVIGDLKRRDAGKDAILYAYFDDEDALCTGSEKGSSVLSDLLSQLIVGPGRETTSEALQELYRQYSSDAISPAKTPIPKRTDIIRILTEEISNFTKVYIVIDALNVISPQDQFQLVPDLLSLKAKLMITSRHEIYAAPDTFSHLLREDNANDINLFIQHKMEFLSSRRHPLMRQSDPWPQCRSAFVDRTIATSDGMFSRASYVMDLVEHQLDMQGIDDVFDELQKHFDDIYKLEVDKTCARWAKTRGGGPKRVLYWVSFTKRAFAIEELQTALACHNLDRTTKGDIDYASKMFELSDILRVCDGFISVKDNTIIFSHPSIQDFFERHASEYFKDTLAKNPIASVCLSYIIHSLSSSTMPHATSSADLGSIEWKDHLHRFPLFSYAVSEWGHHAFIAETADCLDKNLVSKLFQRPASPFLASPEKTGIHPTPDMSPHAYKILFLARFGLNSMLSDKAFWVDVLNIQDARGWTPLFLAIAANNPDVAVTLLKHGADPNIGDQTGETPLHRAAYNGLVAIVLRLIIEGAVVEVEDCRGRTPLSLAAIKGRQQASEALLRYNGANPNSADKGGKTPLHHAAGRGHDKIVSMLLDQNASVDAVDEVGWTPLLYAAARGQSMAVEMLLKKEADPNFQTKKGPRENMGRTALHLAAEGGHSTIITILLNHVPDVNVLDKVGRTALLHAAEKGHSQIVKTLLERGADPTLANETGWTPITQAAFMGYIDIFRLFLDKGAVKPEQTDAWGRGVISYAAEGGSVDILKLLLASDRFQLGQDELDKPDKKQRAPISYAIRPQSIVLELFKRPVSGNIESVKLLLRQPVRIDINRLDERNLTPLRMAKDSRHRDIRSVVRLYAASQDGT